MTRVSAQVDEHASDSASMALPQSSLLDTGAVVNPTVQTDTILQSSNDTGGTAQPDAKRYSIQGRTSLMAVHGTLPYTVDQGNDPGYLLNGALEMTIAGVPMALDVDMSTLVPLYGKANTVRLRLDRERADGLQHAADARSLDSLSRVCERIDDLRRAGKQRLLGLMYQADSIRSALTPGTAHGISGNIGTSTSPPPTLPTPAAMGAGAMPGVSSDAMPSPDSTGVMNGQQSAALPNVGDTMPDASTVGGVAGSGPLPTPIEPPDIESQIEAAKHVSDSLSSRAADLHARRDRLKAVVNARQKRTKVFGKVLSGFDRLELGDCAPNTYTFLLTGIRFQGVSALYDLGGVKIAADHGHTPFDQAPGPGANVDALRALHRSFFLLDDEGLPSRRLSSIGVSTDDPKFKVHLGYLRAEADAWSGSDVSSSGITSPVEQVVELGAEKAVAKNHRVGLTVARAVLPQGTAEGATASDASNAVTDASAVQVDYSAEVPALAGRFATQARVTGPYFRSLGSGFLRRDERRVLMTWTQRATAKLDYKLKGEWRERSTYVPDGPVIGILRGTITGTYRTGRTMKVRATFIPVWSQVAASSTGAGALIFSEMVGVGCDYRGRRKGSTMTALLQVNYYRRAVAGGSSAAYDLNSHVQWQRKDGTALRLGYNAFQADTTGAWKRIQHNLTGEMVLTVAKATRVEGGITLGLWTNEALGWNIALEQPLSAHFALAAKGQRAERPLVPTEDGSGYVEHVDVGWQFGVNMKF